MAGTVYCPFLSVRMWGRGSDAQHVCVFLSQSVVCLLSSRYGVLAHFTVCSSVFICLAVSPVLRQSVLVSACVCLSLYPRSLFESICFNSAWLCIIQFARMSVFVCLVYLLVVLLCLFIYSPIFTSDHLYVRLFDKSPFRPCICSCTTLSAIPSAHKVSQSSVYTSMYPWCISRSVHTSVLPFYKPSIYLYLLLSQYVHHSIRSPSCSILSS